MKSFRVIIHMLAGVILILSTSAARADWIYVPEEGGWKDTETGLVWFDLVVSNDGDPFTGNEAFTWSGVNQATSGLVLFGLDDFFPIPVPLDDWRLPTIEEMQTAADHGIGDASDQAVADGMMPILYGTPGVGYLWWSDYVRGKNATAVNMRTGAKGKVQVSGSTLLGICVRQSTVGP
jgi:hypothetical protein